MLFSLTNPEVAILMMGIFLFAVLLGFPIAFTLMAMGIGSYWIRRMVYPIVAKRWN